MAHVVSNRVFVKPEYTQEFEIAHQNPMPKDAFKKGGGIEQHEVILSSNIE